MNLLKTLVAASILVVTGACLAHESSNQAVTITLKPLPGDDGRIVALSVAEEIFAAELGRPLEFQVSYSLPGMKQLLDRIGTVRAADALGDLPLTIHDDAGDTAHPRRRHWHPARPIRFPMTITYVVTPQPGNEFGGPPYGMKAAGGGIVGRANSFLVLPSIKASKTTVLQWDLSAMPAGSVGASSKGVGRTVIEGPPDSVDPWLLAGPARHLGRADGSGFQGYQMGTPADDASEVLEWSQRSYGYLGSTFGYLGHPTYYLFIRALDGPSFATGTASDGGALVTMGRSYIRGQNALHLHYIIFHEMTHQWVGQIDGESPWFSEGMTTYFSSVLPCTAHFDPWESCAAQINDSAKVYYTSPARNWSQARIESTPFEREDVRRTPYGRGMVYFAGLDARIRQHSNGRRTLLDAMQPLFSARKTTGRLRIADWEAMLVREVGTKEVSTFRKTILEGKLTAEPPTSVYGPCLRRVEVIWRAAGAATSIRGYEFVAQETGGCRLVSG